MDLTPSLVWAARAAVSTSVATLRRLASSFSRSRLAAAACLASICARSSVTVSYTHLTLPTNREV